MKIGVSSYSFLKLLNRGEMTLYDVVDFAKETGYDCIEFTDTMVPEEQEARIAWAKDMNAYCAKKGIEISAWTIGADFINGSNGDTAKEIERLKGEVDVCEALGAHIMRHDITYGFKKPAPGARSIEDAIKLIAPAIREVTEYAEKKGIRTCSENHGYFFQDSSRVEALILAVNHPNYGWLLDMGNFTCADEDCAKAVAIGARYAFHVHAKDFLWKSGTQPKPDDSWFPTRAGNYLRGTIVGHGIVPVAQCVGILKRSGYDATLSLEFEGSEEVRDAITRGYALLRSLA